MNEGQTWFGQTVAESKRWLRKKDGGGDGMVKRKIEVR